MQKSKLFEPIRLGALQLSNRVVMAPMTRSRSSLGDVPNELMCEYYRQRASAGLIITEGVHPNLDGQGYCRTPGIYSIEQIVRWKCIADAVHREGGLIAMQLMHCGRVGHSLNKKPSARTLAPSAIAAAGEIFTEQGMRAMPVPDAMTLGDIRQTINDYRQAARNAFEAGMDAIELHCTSGYLPAQFLSTGTNQRRDEYGGSLENRLRFVVELIDELSSVKGADRLGLRICPANPFNDLCDDNPKETFEALLDAIDAKGLAYLHVIKSPAADIDVIKMAKEHFAGPVIVNDGFDQASAEAILAKGEASAVSFGRSFIANPDLVKRFREGLPLATFDPKALYTEGKQGYTDYPFSDNSV